MSQHREIEAGCVEAYSFVKESATRSGHGGPGEAFRVAQCGAGERPLGISASRVLSNLRPGSHKPGVLVHRDGERCYLIVGEGQLSMLRKGSHIKSDASGFGVAGVLGVDHVGAIALEDGTAGQRIEVEVWDLPA